MASSSRDARYALIIAVDTYQDPDLCTLQAPLRDAAALKEVLEHPEIGRFRAVDVLSNPSAHDAREVIEQFFMKCKPMDVLVLHFSGHAFRGDASEELYLAMTDTQKRAKPDSTSVTGDFISKMLRKSPARRKLLLLDCCHGGALTLARGTGTGTAPDDPEAAVAVAEFNDGFSRGVGNIVPPTAKADLNGTGTIVIAAARAAELAHESDTGALSGAIVEGLASGRADLTGSGQISTDDLYAYVTRWCAEHQPTQHPVRQESTHSGNFIVAENRFHQPILPAEVETLLGAEEPFERLRAVQKLRGLAASANAVVALAARSRLHQVADCDTDWDVVHLAQGSLERTSLTVHPAALHFAGVHLGDPAPKLPVKVSGPPLAEHWHAVCDHPSVIATRRHDGLEVRLEPQHRGPVDATVTIQSDAGNATVRVFGSVERAPMSAVLLARLSALLSWRPEPRQQPEPITDEVGGGRPGEPVVGRPHAGLALVAAAVTVLAATSVHVVPRVQVVGWCIPEHDLRVLATDALRDAVEAAAVAFSAPARVGACPPTQVTVSTTSSDGRAQRLLARQWPDDGLRTAGPSPDVWLPESSTQVDLARDAIPADAARRIDLPGADDVRRATVARSPLVLAVPHSSSSPTSLTFSQVLKGRWTIPRADPRDSTTGLLATTAMYGSGRAEEVEQILKPSKGGDDPRFDLCQHRLSDTDPPSGTAYLVPRMYISDYNDGKPLGAACQTSEQPRLNRQLDPVTLRDAPAIDVPCIAIRGPAWGDAEQHRLADAFCNYLHGPDGRRILVEHGLDPPDTAASEHAPGAAAADSVIRTWSSAQRPIRMLLAVDVSGSMRLPMPGSPTARIEAVKPAARQAVSKSFLRADDEIGLWEFATKLSGSSDHRELVPLDAATSDHQTRLAAELDRLTPSNRNTGLYDTIGAGITALDPKKARTTSTFKPVNLLVVLTDGENDDPGSIGVDQIGAQLRATGVQVSVVALVGANCRAFQPLIKKGLSCQESIGDLNAALDNALPGRTKPAGSERTTS